MKIALAQINSTVGDLAGNQKKIVDYIHRAKDQDADIVIFPEMAICGYPPEDLLFKDHFVQDNFKILRSIYKETKGITGVVGFVDRDKVGNLYNAAAVITNGKLQGTYHKKYLPNYGVFDEKRYFQAGTMEGMFSVDSVNFGVSICEDIWVKTQSASFLHINISCSPYDVGKLKARHQLLKKRAKENNSFIVYVNLVGGQDELVFDGGSLVIDPKGKIIAEAKAFEEDLLIVDLSVRAQQAVPMTQTEGIYKALILGTHDYVKKNGFSKVVIGLSGGIDSALVAVIAVEALGKKNVVCVSMPSKYTSKGTMSDAKQLAENLEVEFKEIIIEETVKSYEKLLSKEFRNHKPNVAEENIQARIRGNILMALSNKFGWLVLTTGNKSEMAVGYCTLYGDMSGGFAVIKDVPKMKVYELAEFINSQGKVIIPKMIIKRAPSAELRPNQKDQDTLPPYEILDEILKKYVENHQPLSKIAKKYNRAIVKKVIQLVDQSEYKRRQSPPGIKITSRAFGKDWRLPIINRYKEF
ncbi:NAD synthetase / Glutamine amidotransferase chain of NAD synthetase [hydrothermal vent metagenome]|uniref:NAD(+) synthase (glutamine-hydrolyzing) n=1 Tax=hydrothermal vent metagenome TaxID=652676 RepID=A0A3B1DEG8_9ZZZZ